MERTPDTENKEEDLLARYNRLLEERPILTKSLSSALISGLGGLGGSKLATGKVNYLAGAAFALHGGLVNGPVGHLWYTWLDEKGPKNLVKATVLDQIVVQPPLCFLMLVLLETFTAALSQLPASIAKARKNALPTVISSWKFWPLAVFLTMKTQ